MNQQLLNNGIIVKVIFQAKMPKKTLVAASPIRIFVGFL